MKRERANNSNRNATGAVERGRPALDSERLDYAGRDLEAMGFARNYHAWIRDEFAPFIHGDVAEVGAGVGSFSELLLELRPRSLTLFEPSAAMHARQSPMLDERAWVRRVNSTLSVRSDPCAATFDSLLYVNVLEHIEDDADELSIAFDALRPGGHLCVFVPALPWLMSRFDRSIGHHRRYTLRALRHKLREAGFALERIRYMDGFGVLPWFLFMTLGRRVIDAASVSAYDRHAVPIVRGIEARVRPLIGKNLLAIARRPQQSGAGVAAVREIPD